MLYFIRRLIHIFVSPTEDTEFLGFDSVIPKRIIDVGDGSLLLYMTIAVDIAAHILIRYTINQVIRISLVLEAIQSPSPNRPPRSRRRNSEIREDATSGVRAASYGFKSNFHHLHRAGGGRSILRSSIKGALIYNIAHHLLTSISGAISSNPTWNILTHLLATALLSGLHLNWTRASLPASSSSSSSSSTTTTIAAQKPMFLPRRGLVLPAMAHAGAGMLMSGIPALLGSSALLSSSSGDGGGGFEGSDKARQVAVRDVFAVIAALLIQTFLVFPTLAVLCSAEGDFLADTGTAFVGGRRRRSGDGVRGDGQEKDGICEMGYFERLGRVDRYVVLRLVYMHFQLSVVLFCLESVFGVVFRAVLGDQGGVDITL